jgi:hypothetical protein
VWRMGLSTFGPLLLFCAARWLVVGSFGLAFFTGHNFAGIVGQFLTEEMVEQLPSDVMPLARAALARRQDLAARDSSFSVEVTRSYVTIENRFNASTVLIFAAAAQEIYQGDPVRMNDGLMRLSLAMIRLRPADYAVWLIKAFCRGVYMIASELVINPVYLILLALLAVSHGRYVWHWSKRGLRPLSADRAYVLQFNTVLLVALAFSLSNVLLVILTAPPLGRYMDAAGIFWPAVIAAIFAHRLAATRELLAGS